MKRTRRRHSTGFGYIGFGNVQSVFNQGTRKAFTEIKDKLNEETHLRHQVHFNHHKLTFEEKQAIKNRIRLEEKRRTIKASIFTLIIGSVLFYFAFNFIQQLINS